MGDRRTLGVIVARGGSKGLARKNLLPLAGRPLVAWSVEAAASAHRLDRVVISTDDAEISQAAVAAGCEAPFERPTKLATDTARVEESVIHALDTLDEPYDLVVLLQATSPLRRGTDIDDTITHLLETGAPSCVTVSAPAKSPYWMFQMDDASRLQPLFPDARGSRRQDLPPAYVPNGAVYVAEVDWFRVHRSFYSAETVAHIMPAERSVDVDSALDLALCRALLV